MMEDLEDLVAMVERGREQLATLKEQLAEARANRDAYYNSMNEAHAEAMRDKQLLATARRDVLLDAVNEVQQAYIGQKEITPMLTNVVDVVVEFLRQQAKKETP